MSLKVRSQLAGEEGDTGLGGRSLKFVVDTGGKRRVSFEVISPLLSLVMSLSVLSGQLAG